MTIQLPIDWFKVCPAKNTDPETSHLAAQMSDRASQRIQVLKYLESRGGEGATDYEIGRDLGILRTSAGKRRHELREIGLVEDAGFNRLTDTGSTAIVWKIKDERRLNANTNSE